MAIIIAANIIAVATTIADIIIETIIIVVTITAATGDNFITKTFGLPGS